MTTEQDKSFGKEKRLCNRSEIDELFRSKDAEFAYPFRVVVVECVPRRDLVSDFKVLISVSKRNHKRAVTRNLLKRRIREAFRLNRHGLPHPSEGKSLRIALIYTGREVVNYQIIEHGVKKAITKITLQLQKRADHAAAGADLGL